MGNVPLSALWVNVVVISGTWGSSFVFAKWITESMHPFAFAALRGFIVMSALLVWLALPSRAPPIYHGTLPSPRWTAGNPAAVEAVHYNGSTHCDRGTLVAVARKRRAGDRL
jgi:drug/metabolite transporter (DMT)-like permease